MAGVSASSREVGRNRYVAASLYRSEMRIGLHCLRVFADQSVEDLPSTDPRRGEVDDGWTSLRGLGWPLVAVLMGPVLCTTNSPRGAKQVPRSVDQRPVQTLATDRAHPAFRICVRPRRLRWSTEDLDAFAGERLVEHVSCDASQRKSVAGVTRKVAHTGRGKSRDRAEGTTRSLGSRSKRLT